MTRDEVVKELCDLAAFVNETAFGWAILSDCFCLNSKDMPDGFQFDARVLDFIKEAVTAKLEEE